LLRPVQQSPARIHFGLYLTYHFKSDGSETRAAAQDALMTACRTLQPARITVHVVGRHSRSPTSPKCAHACGSVAATSEAQQEEEEAWVRFARSAAAALPSLRHLFEGRSMFDLWDEAGRVRGPMSSALRAARLEAAEAAEV
jgi:hypothetical protein